MLLQSPQPIQSHTAMVTVRGQPGFVFVSAGQSDYCFVPVECVYRQDDGLLLVNEIAYFRSGWAVRNRRLRHPEADGSFLFPEQDGLVADPGSAPVQEFLRRLAGWNASPVSAH